jgi:VWFA-related protein
MRPLVLVIAILLTNAASAQVEETITVERILIDVRVTDWRDHPVTDLTAGDFRVRIGGKEAAVESVRWVDDVGAEPAPPLPDAGPVARFTPTAPIGRLFVLFIQTDFAREKLRVHGQMKFLGPAEAMIRELEPADRVAVFSFDSHLKFRSDLTTDRDATVEALQRALYIDHPGPPPMVPSPALARHLDREEMKRAASSESGLRIVGRALRAIPGPKSLLLLGWGLGELSGGAVRMTPEWELARRELEAARVTLFSLDTSAADYHSLEVGLASAAHATGGFYAKTHLFPRSAIDRLQRTLVGHYEIELRRPKDLAPGTHELSVRVNRRRVDVLAPQSWMDRP